jgi:DNA mismatch endonuclease (patch repair protein)
VERHLRQKLPEGKFLNVSPERSRTMASIKGKHTKSTERKLRMALMRAGIRGWTLHPRGLPGNPDVYFAKSGIVVFVDGCFWHGCPKCGHVPHTNSEFWHAKFNRNRERDLMNTRALKKLGMNVIRIWEHSLKNHLSTTAAIDGIRLALKGNQRINQKGKARFKSMKESMVQIDSTR